MENKLPFSQKQLEGMAKLGIMATDLEKMLKNNTLEEVAKYVRISLKPGDDGDEAAGPRIIDQ